MTLKELVNKLKTSEAKEALEQDMKDVMEFGFDEKQAEFLAVILDCMRVIGGQLSKNEEQVTNTAVLQAMYMEKMDEIIVKVVERLNGLDDKEHPKKLVIQ
jgi:hypothetical protein